MKTLLIFVLGLLAGLVITYGLCATGNLPFECTSEGGLAIIDSTGTVTEIDTTAADNLVIDYQTYESFSNAYSNNYITDASMKINGYLGGRIELSALQQILSQVEPGQTFISYRMGYTEDLFSDSRAISASPTPGIVLMLSSGNFKSTPSGPARDIIKNGNTAQLFCPTWCD